MTLWGVEIATAAELPRKDNKGLLLAMTMKVIPGSHNPSNAI